MQNPFQFPPTFQQGPAMGVAGAMRPNPQAGFGNFRNPLQGMQNPLQGQQMPFGLFSGRTFGNQQPNPMQPNPGLPNPAQSMAANITQSTPHVSFPGTPNAQYPGGQGPAPMPQGMPMNRPVSNPFMMGHSGQMPSIRNPFMQGPRHDTPQPVSPFQMR